MRPVAFDTYNLHEVSNHSVALKDITLLAIRWLCVQDCAPNQNYDAKIG